MKCRAVALLPLAIMAATSAAGEQDVVELYGRVYLTAEHVRSKGDEGNRTPDTRVVRLADQASLVGIRGTERLTGEWRAFFQLETAFRPDQNDGPFATRNSAVGLGGPWGTLLLGRWDTPLKAATLRIDPFGDLTMGGITAALNGSGVDNVQASFDRRDQNLVQYWSPAAGCVHARLSHVVNEGRTSFIDPSRFGASLVCAADALYAGYAYDEVRDDRFGQRSFERQRAHAVFASWIAGAWKAGAVYEVIDRRDFVRQRAWMVNLVWTAGAHQWIGQFQRARGGGDPREGAPQAPAPRALVLTREQPACKVYALAYQYHFTRRTFGLAQWVRISNNSAGTCNFGSNPMAIGIGQDLEGAALGLRHLF